MPASLVRCDLDLVFPPLVERMLEVMARCRTRGAEYYWISGYRSWADQHILRLKYLNKTGGRAAPAGFSAHNYGLAGDLSFDCDPARGLQPRWKDEDYDILGEEAEKAGLLWGKSFGDRPHVQWPGFVSGTELSILRNLWKQSAESNAKLTLVKVIWPFVEKHAPL